MEASSRSILVEDVNDGDEDTFGVETDTEADFDFDEPEEITDDFLDELSPYASTTNFDFGASATSAAFENYNMSAAGTALVDNNASTDFDFLSDPVPGGTENGNGPAAGLEAPSAAGGGDNALDAFGDGIGDAATPDAAPVGRGLFGTLGRMGRMVVNGAGGGRSANDQSPPDLLDMDSGADDPNGTTGQQFQVDLAGGMAVQSDSTDNGSNDVDPFDGIAAGETGEPQTPSGGGLFGTLGRMGRMVVNSAGKTNGNDDDPTPHDLLDDDGGFPPDRFDDEAEQQQGGPEGSAGADSDAPTQQAAGGLFGTLGRMGGRVGGRIFRSRSPEQVDPSGDNDLDADGNSLPHPGSLESNNSNVVNPMGDSGDLSNLGGQGNSLPHPEALMRQSNAAPPAADTGNVSGNNDDAILDVNGNSLPHPDAMNPDSLAISKEDENLDILHGVGNSLPHPEALMRQSNSSARDFGNNDGENDDAILDVDGNSLPHPDTMKSKNVVNGKDDENLDILGGNGNSLPHPETLMRKSIKTIEGTNNGDNTDNDDAILDVDGNSLPHPDTMKSKNVANGKDDENLDILGGNGNSLPHPETLMRKSIKTIEGTNNGDNTDNDDAILDVDGNSLPHPDAMKSKNVANGKDDENLDILGGNGNSLPHPETLMRKSIKTIEGTNNGDNTDNDDAILDVDGNSLPHPDTMKSKNVANGKDDENLDILGGNGNSLPHPETLMRKSIKTIEGTNNGDNTDNDDAILDVDGNSLPHPDTMKSKNVANGKDDENLDILGGNGNSLPHPETLMRKSIKTIEGTNNGDNTDNDDAILDVDGNSLPHPDTMKSKNVANGKDDENLDILGGNGNSLPHPETLMRKSIKTIEGTNNGDNTDNDDAILDVDGNSLPHPDAMKSKNVANGKGEEDLENLDGNGNSLPHPETLMRKAKAASPDNGNEDGNNDAILDENGNSLPHPDAMKSKNVANGKGEEDLENLDGNGNSLPHPETLKENYPVTMLQKIRAFAAGESGDNDESILDENGSSLPNPDVMKSRSGSNSEEDEDLENLDGNGNSLPHPDTLMRQSKDKALAATREICADGYNDNDNASENGDIILDDNGNSLPHPDTLRGMTSTDNLLADIESATNAQDNKSSNNNVEDCSSNGEDRLDCGGNSLPHPDTIKASATSVRRRTASSLFGNIRRSVMSTLPGISILNYSEIETPTSQDQDDFRDEENAVDDMNAVASRSTLDAALLRQSDENRNALQHSGASFRDSSSRSIFTIDDSIESNFISDSNSLSTFGGMSRMSIGRSTGKLLDANGSSLPSQEEGASSGSASKHSSRRLRELGQSFLSTLNARASSSSLRSNGAAQREQEEFNFEDNAYIEGDAGIDEEYGRKSGTWHSNRDVEFDNNGFPVAYRVDRFDDERSRGEKDSSNSSRKERIQKLFKEQTERFQDQRYSWRLGCLLFAVFLIFLGMLIPLITLARERRQRIAVTAPPVATAPTESPIIETIGYDVDCDDEIDLVDENGKKVGDESNSIVTLSGNSDIVACYTTEQPIMFRFKRCRPSSLDFTGVFPLGSLFMDQLWQPYYAASYLCGEQPCPSGGANPPITKVMTGPPIAKPGDYRIFLVKESLWPYEYSVYTPLFRVVEDGQECPIPDDQIVTPVPVN